MSDLRTDRIAREAARLIETGRAGSIDSAIRTAAQALGLPGVPLPGAGRVRKHAQGMSMQALGSAGYAETRLKVWRIAEQIMTALEHALPDAQTLLAGRAAQGHIDAGLTVHIRVYTRASINKIAQFLVELGYEEPAFVTHDTSHGRLNQIHFTEEGLKIALTRCPRELQAEQDCDLVTGRKIQTLKLIELQQHLSKSQA